MRILGISVMNKAIFLDRDGTITKDRGYTFKPEDLIFLPNSIEGLKKLSGTCYKLIIVTNQSGIGRGYYTEEDYYKFREEMHKRLRKEKINIDAEYFCPHNPKENCGCRKPKIGMLEDAANDFWLDLNKCWMVGDSISDMQAGKSAGCRTIHILTGYEKIKINEIDYLAKDLLEVANIIKNG